MTDRKRRLDRIGRPLGIRSALLAASFGVTSFAARAECPVPSPPPVAERPVKPTLPAKGPCVDAKPGTAGCMGWEAYSYNDAVKAYNAALPAFQTSANTYVAKLNAYVAASGDYARCEVKALE